MAEEHGNIEQEAPQKKPTLKQWRFIEFLLADPSSNGQKAAIRAGYSPNSAKRTAWELLNSPRYTHVQEALERRRLELQQEMRVEQRHVVEELKRIAFSRLGDVVKWDKNGVWIETSSDELSPELMSVVSEVEQIDTAHGRRIRVKLHNKLEAIEKLGRMFGWFKDTVKHEFPEGTVGVVLLPERRERDADA